MAVLVILDIEGATLAQYDAVDELMGGTSADNAPEGLISHTAGETETGLIVADVWESAEAMQRAFEAHLGPALEKVGVPPAHPRILPVHNHLHGRGDEAGVIVIAEIEGMSADDYDRLTADMAAHAGDGGAHPAVSHIAAVSDDGLVAIDVWASEEEFGRFAESELAPRAGGAWMR
jgi:hypothetical protein